MIMGERNLHPNAASPARGSRWNPMEMLRRRDAVHIALASVAIGLIYVIFHLQGNRVDAFNDQRSTLAWMYFRWITGRVTYGNVYYILGLLVPVVSALLVWVQRRELQDAAKKVNWLGMVVVGGSLATHFVGVKTEHPRLSLLALIGMIWGVPFFLFGWQVARRLLFPCAYLVFCIPLNFLDSLVFRLRVLIARITALILNGLGLECASSGASIVGAEPGGLVLNMHSSTAGLSSLLLTAAVAALVAYLSQRTHLKKWTLFLLTLPAYLVASVLAMVLAGLLSAAFGKGLADVFTAHLYGWAVLLLSVILLGVVARVLRAGFTVPLFKGGHTVDPAPPAG